MKKSIITISLFDLAKLFEIELPHHVMGSTKVWEINGDYSKADDGALTYMTEIEPGKLYRCKASVVLVPLRLKNIVPLDEGVQVIPVENPAALFTKIHDNLD